MTIRKLPAIELGVIAASAIEISAQAMARWDETVRAATDAGDNTISVLDTIGEDFWGEGVTAKRVMAALRTIGDRDVVVNINSPGGNMFEGLAIYNALRTHPKKVTVRVLGIAASAASVVAMAGDVVEVAKAGFIMIHNANVPDAGNRHDKRGIADKLEQFDGAMAGLYASRSGMTTAQIAAMMDDETFMSGDEAVANKFADALLPADTVKHGPKAELTALTRIDRALARGERLPRAERRALFSEITGTPRAADEPATPGAGDTTGLSIALARLKLMRA